jgi:hypothetical protein
LGLRGRNWQSPGGYYIMHSCAILRPNQIFSGDKDKEDETDRVSDTEESLFGKAGGKNHIDDVGVDERIILKCIPRP